MILPYDRSAAVSYARRWAYSRNPYYYDFETLGGDCTNFASQCLYAGTGVMNFTPDVGWYYLSPTDRAAAWTGVAYLGQFLLRPEQSPGPYASLTDYRGLRPGDLVQLNITGMKYTHTLIVVATGKGARPNQILVAAHSYDTFGRPLSTYYYRRIRCLHIQGAYSD